MAQGHRRSRLDDADEVRLSADAAALSAAQAEPSPGLLALLGAFLERLFARLQRALASTRVPEAGPAALPDHLRLPTDPPRAPEGRNRRVHERFDSFGCTVRIDSTVYEVLDVSLGGFTFGPDYGQLVPNQRFYCELSIPGEPRAEPLRADGKVVRVHDGVVAARFFLPLSATRRLIAAFVAHHRNRDIERG